MKKGPSESQQEGLNPVVAPASRMTGVAKSTSAKVLALLAVLGGLNGCESDSSYTPVPMTPPPYPACTENCDGASGSGGTAGTGGSLNVGGSGGTAGNPNVGGSAGTGGSPNVGGSAGTGGVDNSDTTVYTDVWEINPNYIGNPSAWETWRGLVNDFQNCYPNCENGKFTQVGHTKYSENISCPSNEPNCQNPGKGYIVVSAPWKNGNLVHGGACRNYTMHTNGQLWGDSKLEGDSSAKDFGPYAGNVSVKYADTDKCPSYTAVASTYSFDVDSTY